MSCNSKSSCTYVFDNHAIPSSWRYCGIVFTSTMHHATEAHQHSDIKTLLGLEILLFLVHNSDLNLIEQLWDELERGPITDNR